MDIQLPLKRWRLMEMECCDLTRNFLQGRKGRTLKVSMEGGGLTPVTGKLVDFDDAALVLSPTTAPAPSAATSQPVR